ncbi:unnamed protein product [Trifolium pratense]|uniref:Uncharacterized protein n=1 Tax=Trifolium pratense TaxID=57577 RepID=A0ACB0LQV7_TRIPR|nr:unnamed protein product [Trifolium pratense]
MTNVYPKEISLASQSSFPHSTMVAPTMRASSSSFTDQMQDQSSTYYVHPSDGPSSIVVKHLLTGSNYHSCARSM